MKNFGRKMKAVGYGVAGLAASASSALASSNWYDGITVDTSAVTAVAGIVAVGLAATWGIRKVIKLINRS